MPFTFFNAPGLSLGCPWINVESKPDEMASFPAVLYTKIGTLQHTRIRTIGQETRLSTVPIWSKIRFSRYKPLIFWDPIFFIISTRTRKVLTMENFFPPFSQVKSSSFQLMEKFQKMWYFLYCTFFFYRFGY